ncbi:CRAL/TRIO domain-containing protein, partial [Clathrospora elynae]
MMAATPEVINTASSEGASLLGGAGLEKQPEPNLTAVSSEKKDESKVDAATAGVAGLSVNKTEDEDKKTEDAPPTYSEPPAAGPSDTKPNTVTPTQSPFWPETAPDHPLTKFYDAFEALVTEAQHNEVYGIELTRSKPFHTKLILQKFLRANQNDVDKAKQQLLDTLKWRKEFDPIKAAGETFETSRFEGLGYVLELEGVPESVNKKDIATFNIYGAVKDNKKTFGDLNLFLRWRVGLMEKSIQALSLPTASTPIPDFNAGPDPYQGLQIHDYLQVSFLRQDPLVKAATKETIAILQRHYPETLSRKFFVNVPLVMGWLFSAMKLVVAKETTRKFTVLSYGKELAGELGRGVPKSYGGDGGELGEVGKGMKLK